MRRTPSLILIVAGLTALQASHARTPSVSFDIRVEDRTGRPVPGAAVEIVSGVEPDGEAVATATTGNDGRGVVQLSPGEYRVRVAAEDFVERVSELAAVGTTPVELSLQLFPGAWIGGRIVDAEGHGIAGAELCLRLHGASSFPQSAIGRAELDDEGRHCVEADAEGGVATPILPHGDYDVSAVSTAHVPWRGKLRLDADTGVRQWQLQAGGVVKGRLVDDQNRPVPDASVALQHRSRGTTADAVTDEEGRFVIAGLASGFWMARIEPPAGAVILRDGLEIGEGATLDVGLLRVRRGQSIDGRVVDQDGDPVAGASISVRETDQIGRPLREIESGDDGRFVAAGLPEAAVHLLVDGPQGFAAAAVEEVEAPGRDLVVELEAAGRVCGTIATADGHVPEGVLVTVLPRELGFLDRFQELLRATTRQIEPRTGGFCVDDVYPAMDVEISGSAPGYWAQPVNRPVGAGEDAEDVELVLERGIEVEGSVVDPSGSPVPDASVRSRGGSMTYADGLGEFRLAGLRPGMNELGADHPDHASVKRPVMLPLPEGESLVLQLGVGGKIEGSVRRRDGEGMAGVPIQVSDPHRTSWTDDDGRYEFEYVSAGAHTVTRKAAASYDDFEHREVEVVAGETSTVDFVLGAVMQGQLLRGGVPVPGAMIAIAQPHDTEKFASSDHRVQRTYSQEDGTYRLAGVQPGWTTVTIEHERQTVIRPAEIPPGDEPRVDFHLPFMAIHGRVSAADDDHPLAGASMNAQLAAVPGAPDTGGSSSYASSESSGQGIRYNLTSRASARTMTLADGTFRLYVDENETPVGAWAAGYGYETLNVDPRDGEPALFRLSRELKVAVVLTDTNGRPTNMTRVCLIENTDNGQSRMCSVGGPGRSEHSVSEGAYTILASATGFGTKVLETELRVPEDGSTHEIPFQLTPGADLTIRLVGYPSEEARVVALSDPAGQDRLLLLEPPSIDPATGDRSWGTWTLEPGTWTVTVDTGAGDTITKSLDVAPGPQLELAFP